MKKPDESILQLYQIRQETSLEAEIQVLLGAVTYAQAAMRYM